MRVAWLIERRFGSRGTPEFARAIGVPTQTVRNWIDRGSQPTIEAIVAVMERLQVDPSWLLIGRGEPWPTVLPETKEGNERVEATLQHVLNCLDELGRAASQLLPLLHDEQAASLGNAIKKVDQLLATSLQQRGIGAVEDGPR